MCRLLQALTGSPLAWRADEAAEALDAPSYVPGPLPKDRIPCYDPSTMQLLGYAPAMTPAEVRAAGAQLYASRCRASSRQQGRSTSVTRNCCCARMAIPNTQVNQAIADAREASKVGGGDSLRLACCCSSSRVHEQQQRRWLWIQHQCSSVSVVSGLAA